MTEKFFFYQDGYTYLKINIDEVILLRAKRNYVYLITANKIIITRATLQSAVQLLSEHHFVKINRTHAVCLRYISIVERDSVWLRCPGSIIPLARKLDEFQEPYFDIPGDDRTPDKLPEFIMIQYTVIPSLYDPLVKRLTIIGNSNKRVRETVENVEDEIDDMYEDEDD